MLLSCQTLDVLHAFYLFSGTNLLIQCQVPVRVIFHVFDPFQRIFGNRVQTEENPRKDFFCNGRRSGSLRAKAGEPQGPHKPPPRGQGEPRHPGLWAPWRSPDLDLAPINSQIFPKKSGEHRNHFSAAASFCLRKIPSGARSGTLPEGGFGYGGASSSTP